MRTADPELLPRRLRNLPRTRVLGREVPVARGRLSRLLGLALLRRGRAGPGLLLPNCSAVHTVGMRFPIDVVFLDRRGLPLRRVDEVRPGRFLSERRAAAVLELPS